MWSLSLVMSECSLSGAWSGSREQFLHCGLREFRHSKSSVDKWYTKLNRRRFVYDSYMTMKATRTRHSWVHMFATHWPTLTLQLHNFDLFSTCRTALLHGNWQDFNWHGASRGPSAIAEFLVSWTMFQNFLTIHVICMEWDKNHVHFECTVWFEIYDKWCRFLQNVKRVPENKD